MARPTQHLQEELQAAVTSSKKVILAQAETTALLMTMKSEKQLIKTSQQTEAKMIEALTTRIDCPRPRTVRCTGPINIADMLQALISQKSQSYPLHKPHGPTINAVVFALVIIYLG